MHVSTKCLKVQRIESLSFSLDFDFLITNNEMTALCGSITDL